MEPFRWLPDGWLEHQAEGHQGVAHLPETLPYCLVCSPERALERLHEIALLEAPRSTAKPALFPGSSRVQIPGSGLYDDPRRANWAEHHQQQAQWLEQQAKMNQQMSLLDHRNWWKP